MPWDTVRKPYYTTDGYPICLNLYEETSNWYSWLPYKCMISLMPKLQIDGGIYSKLFFKIHIALNYNL